MNLKKYFILLFALILTSSFSFTAMAMSDEDLAKKREGVYFTGLPLVNFDSNTGLGGGARVYFYDNGKKDNPLFTETPYLLQAYAQLFITTKMWQYHELHVDMLRVGGTNLRLNTSFYFDKYATSNFYGIGAKAADAKLVNPETGKEFSTLADYTDNFIKGSNVRYNQFGYTKPTYYANMLADITSHFKILCGLQFQYTWIDTYGGQTIDGVLQSATLLDKLKDSVTGYNGGWNNMLRLGVAFDTRDFEPDPTNGFYGDYAIELNTKILGSDYTYMRQTIGLRYYHTLFFKSLVLATRIGYTDVNGDAPFFDMNAFGFALDRYTGIGGKRTNRGYVADRFIGKTMAIGSVELRWKFIEVNPLNQLLAFKLVAFYDVGNVYDNAFDPIVKPRVAEYKHAAGGGLILAWNQATVAHFYYGMSAEEWSMSINFGHSF